MKRKSKKSKIDDVAPKRPTKKTEKQTNDITHKFNPKEFEPDFEEGLPRKFKDVLHPPKIVTKKEQKAKEEKEGKRNNNNNKSINAEEEWIRVRPGESFPEYNARMKSGEKPFTVPPRIIQTTPGYMEDITPVTGSKRKERRTAYLRERKKSHKGKLNEDEFKGGKSQKRPLLNDFVKEPAKLTSKPKEVFKGKQQKRTNSHHAIDLTKDDGKKGTFGKGKRRQGIDKYNKRQSHDRNDGNTERPEKRRKPKAKRYFELVKPELHPQ